MCVDEIWLEDGWYMYMCIYIYVYMYIYVCICIYVYMCMVYVCMCACVRSAARSHWERSHRVDDTILSTGAPLYIYIYIYILTRVYIYLGAHVNIWARQKINAIHAINASVAPHSAP